MKLVKIALIMLAVLILSTSASALSMPFQFGLLTSFPMLSTGINPIGMFSLGGFTGMPSGLGSTSIAPVSFDNLFPSMPTMFPGFTSLESFSPIDFSSGNTNNIAVNALGTDTSLASSSGPMEVNLTYLYTASSPADEYLYVDSLHGSGVTVATHPTGQALQALELVSTTSLYKQYTQYPHTPWRYLDLSGGGYAAGSVDLTTEICPNFPSGASDPSQWYNASAPASGELFFCVNVYTGQILNQNFNSYQNVM